MDLFFTACTWCGSYPPTNNVTLERNQFFASRMPNSGSPHYYGLVIGPVGSNPTGWVIRNNWFENAVSNDKTFSNSVFCGNTGQAPSTWRAACP